MNTECFCGSNNKQQLFPRQRLVKFQNIAHFCQRYYFLKFFSRLIVILIRLVYGAHLPAEATIHRSVHFGHKALAVVINKDCIIEEGCFVGTHVVLGGKSPVKGAPHLEPYAIVHAGTIVIGPITIGRNAVVGANSVVTKDVPSGWTVAGVPAKQIKTSS